MKESNSKIDTMIKIVINKVVEGEARGWPPGCATLLYQPERPAEPSDKKE